MTTTLPLRPGHKLRTVTSAALGRAQARNRMSLWALTTARPAVPSRSETLSQCLGKLRPSAAAFLATQYSYRIVIGRLGGALWVCKFGLEYNRIRWLLLTTLAVDTPEQCRRIAEYYYRRRRIEEWHRILKSGCKVGELANRTAIRLARAAAVNRRCSGWDASLAAVPSGGRRADCAAGIDMREGAVRETGGVGRRGVCCSLRAVSRILVPGVNGAAGGGLALPVEAEAAVRRHSTPEHSTISISADTRRLFKPPSALYL